MPSADSSEERDDSPDTVRVLIVLDEDGSSREYNMYTVKRLDARGALLEGPLLLEVGETLTLRIETPKAPLAVSAVVASVRLDEQAMDVSFKNLSSDERRQLTDHASKARGR